MEQLAKSGLKCKIDKCLFCQPEIEYLGYISPYPLPHIKDMLLKWVISHMRRLCQVEIEYLGYIITKEGIKPQPKKVQAILDMQHPTTKTEVRHFLGMVQYYRDLWPRRSEICAPLTELTRGSKKGSVEWNDRCETTFISLKRLIAKDCGSIEPCPRNSVPPFLW